MFNPYLALFLVSVLVILSYLFDIASKKWKIPSVLFLLGTGVAIKQISLYYNIDIGESFFSYLHLLGIIGLIMIVLEAAVDLNIKKDKIPMIRKSALLALFILLVSSVSIGGAIMYILDETFYNCLIYAIPLSVVSSAVLIPSVHTLTKDKKEFLIYESTFSDIIGIMFFNYIVLQEAEIFTFGSLLTILSTIALSIILSFVLVYLFSLIKTDIKIFLMLAILLFLYAVGKEMHQSPLLMVFVFGLVLNNARLVFFGKMGKRINFLAVESIKKDFSMITAETAFVVRTFFFVAFGMLLDFNTLLDPLVLIVGTIIVILLYIVRYLNFKTFLHTNVFPEIFLAPRGLITILLFFQIPKAYEIAEFGVGILFFVILATGLIMMIALLMTPEAKVEELTVIDFGLGPSSDHANVDVIGRYSEYDDLLTPDEGKGDSSGDGDGENNKDG